MPLGPACQIFLDTEGKSSNTAGLQFVLFARMLSLRRGIRGAGKLSVRRGIWSRPTDGPARMHDAGYRPAATGVNRPRAMCCT
ncbi:MAG: hypothetical protein ACREMA_10535, partial [Longimicrobiales bacterium]